MRYVWCGIAMFLLQVFSILIQARGGFFYAYGFNFVLSLGIMMFSAKLFEDKQRTFLRYMRDFLPYLLQTVCVIGTDLLLALLAMHLSSKLYMPDYLVSADTVTIILFAFVSGGMPYILIQILCAAVGFLIAAGFSIADYINRRR
jgi:hypothetical protein